MSTAPTTPDTTDTSKSTALSTTRPTPGTLPAPGFAADTWNVMTRELRPMLREPASVLFAMVQPLVFLALFAPLLPDSSAFGGSALQWFVPGIIAMTALMGASMTGSNLTLEINTGSHERLLVSPLRRSSLLVGRALKEVVPMLAQGLLIVAVVTPFDFELHPAGVLVGLALLSLFSVGVGALSFALAVVSAGQDWIFWTVQQTVIFPLLLLAGVLLPLDGAPGWLQLLADLNPLGYIVEAERALFAGTWPAGTIAAGAGSAAVVAAIGLVVGLRTMRRSS